MNTEILEGNKLIAEFMGAVKSTKDCDGRYLRFPEPFLDTNTYAFYPKDLKYNSSWDWIMEVINKIEQLGYKTLIKNYDLSNWNYTLIRKELNWIADERSESKIESTWLAVVKFIKWYNANKTN